MREEDMASLIRALADPDETVRQDSAAAIFRGASKLVAPALREWLADPELAHHVLAGAATPPRITVGLAVEPAHFDLIRAANGSPRLADVPPDQDAKEFELDFDPGVCLDILASRDRRGSGAIARYLQRFGEGIQQIEIDVSDVDRAMELLRSRFGVQPIYAASRAGADGTRVNFFLVPVPSGGKILIELVQHCCPP
jgi:hypothetical protein